jgi:hypothetical protein
MKHPHHQRKCLQRNRSDGSNLTGERRCAELPFEPKKGSTPPARVPSRSAPYSSGIALPLKVFDDRVLKQLAARKANVLGAVTKPLEGLPRQRRTGLPRLEAVSFRVCGLCGVPLGLRARTPRWRIAAEAPCAGAPPRVRSWPPRSTRAVSRVSRSALCTERQRAQAARLDSSPPDRNRFAGHGKAAAERWFRRSRARQRAPGGESLPGCGTAFDKKLLLERSPGGDAS